LNRRDSSCGSAPVGREHAPTWRGDLLDRVAGDCAYDGVTSSCVKLNTAWTQSAQHNGQDFRLLLL